MQPLYYTLLITNKIPIPKNLMHSIKQIEILKQTENRSILQIQFELLTHELYQWRTNLAVRVFNRVNLLLNQGIKSYTLFDGIITHIQLNPVKNNVNQLIITAEDISFVLDREGKITSYPQKNDWMIVNEILGQYQSYNFVTNVIAPPHLNTPNINDRIPMQYGTDWQYLKLLAKKYNYVCYLTTEANLKNNIFYWGPKPEIIKQHPQIKVNAGPFTNVVDVKIEFDATKDYQVKSYFYDDKNVANNIELSKVKHNTLNKKFTKTIINNEIQGLDYQTTKSYLNAELKQINENKLLVQGEVDWLRYPSILSAREVIDIFGIGNKYDGKYTLATVHHFLTKSKYIQKFTAYRNSV